MSETSHTQPKYGLIFILLLVLTVLEVFAANLGFSKSIIVAIMLAFAILKATLVAMFYMHLKYEKILLTVLALAPLIFSVILVVMVSFDIR